MDSDQPSIRCRYNKKWWPKSLSSLSTSFYPHFQTPITVSVSTFSTYCSSIFLMCLNVVKAYAYYVAADMTPDRKPHTLAACVDEWHSGVRSEDILMVISLYYMKQFWQYKKWGHFHHPTRLISTRQVLTGDKSCEKLIRLFFALLKWVCHDSENFAKWRPSARRAGGQALEKKSNFRYDWKVYNLGWQVDWLF